MPAFILGRSSLRPAAFVLYHVPRVLSPGRSFLVRPPYFTYYLHRQYASSSIYPFTSGPRVCQLRALVNLRRQITSPGSRLFMPGHGYLAHYRGFLKSAIPSGSYVFYGMSPMVHRSTSYQNTTVPSPPWGLCTGGFSYGFHRYFFYKLP